MEHAGVDLESVKLKTWSEASTILWQVSSALSQVERNLRFEHRDLHWGNILVQRHAEESQLESESAHDLPACLSSINMSVSATIIDFTLSRADVPVSPNSRPSVDLQTLSGGFDDEWMFTGEGDYQYECYRIMKRLVQSNWEQYRPATNVVVSKAKVCSNGCKLTCASALSGCITSFKSYCKTRASRSLRTAPQLGRWPSEQTCQEPH